MTRVAILGLGFMGLTHYKCYEKIKDAQVTVIASRSERKASGDLTGAGGNLGDGEVPALPMDRIHGTTDLHAALRRDDVDVVDICLPTPLHHEYVIAALDAGKHVICEKPIAVSVAEAEPIVEAANKADTFFMPALCMRFWPAWRWLKEAVDDQRFGKVRGASFIRNTSAPEGWFRDGEKSGGAAMDLHIHDTDYIHHLFGKPKAVTTQGYPGPTGQIDHLATLYDYDGVPLVYSEASWTLDAGSGFTCRAMINFEHATAHFDILGEGSGLKLAQDGELADVDCSDFGSDDGWEGQLRYFIDCVQRNQRPTLATADSALESMRTVEAECRSAASGQPVTC